MSERAAKEIKGMLGRHDISKAELARRLQVSHTWVTNRLTGQQEIGLNELGRIAAVLGVSVADLLPREVGTLNDRSATGRPAPHAVEIRSPNVAGTRRRPKARYRRLPAGVARVRRIPPRRLHLPRPGGGSVAWRPGAGAPPAAAATPDGRCPVTDPMPPPHPSPWPGPYPPRPPTLSRCCGLPRSEYEGHWCPSNNWRWMRWT